MASVSFPGNVSFGGTVSSPLFVSNQQIIAPFAAGTTSTLSVGSFASTYSNILQAYAATLTIGTLLNFSAGGSLGTNLLLSGSITAVTGSISTLTVGSLATSFLQASTLSASTYLNVTFNQTSSTTGTTSSSYQMGTLAVGGGGSFDGTLAAACFTNLAVLLYTADIAGSARVSNPSVNTATPSLISAVDTVSSLYLCPSLGSTMYNSINQAGDVSLVFGVGSYQASSALTIAPWSADTTGLPITNVGTTCLTGFNLAVPTYTVDIAGSARVSGNISIGTTVATSFPSGQVTLGNGTNVLNLTASYGATVSHIEAFNSTNSVKNALCLNAYGGNVGIGTPASAAFLHCVGGSSSSANQLHLQPAIHSYPAAIVFNTYGANFGNNPITRIVASSALFVTFGF